MASYFTTKSKFLPLAKKNTDQDRMINFKLFFDLVSREDFSTITDISALLHSVKFADQDNIRWRQIDLAIVGLNTCGEADRVRQQLYRLGKSHVNYRILDLGNLRLTDDMAQNHLAISEVCKGLMEENILPVLIGAENHYALGQYWAYQELEKMVYVLNIDSRLDIRESSPNLSEKYLSKLLLHQPNYLFSMGLIAYQAYLNDGEALEMCKKLHFDLLSVGELRDDIRQAEPLLRMADMVSIDIAALRRAEAPEQVNSFHFGLTGEEIAQLAWYAGLADKVSSLGIYGYFPEKTGGTQTAEVIAVALWYFFEGFYHRKGEFPIRENFYTKYTVPLLKEDISLVFYKSHLSERWWLEISQESDKRKTLVPCSFEDYQEALTGNLPDRWLRAIARN